jgi:putative phosphoserine phosphatase/1-acylglycerol-3-phosphate O-acyltransferase
MSDTDTRVAAILRGRTGPRIAAFFDFDGTLIDGFSATAFLGGAGIAVPRLLGAAWGGGPVPIARLLAGRLLGEPSDGDIRFAQQTALRVSRDMSEDELAAMAERVFAERIAARLRPELWSLVQAHRRMGHRVAVVTAATRWQVGPLAARLGIDDVLCGGPATVAGRGTGAPHEPLLRGGAKTAAVLDFASEHGIDLAASHAYGDAGDDVSFLEVCGNPCAVRPRSALAETARERGWEILDLDRRAGLGPVTAARSLAAWSGVLAGVGAGLGLAATGRDGRAAAEFGMAVASRACLELAGVRVSVHGGAHLGVRPAVFLFNHQSWLDVAVMARLLRRDYTGFAKDELSRVPGLARFGRLLDVVFVDRGAQGAGSDHFNTVLELLSRGVSVAVAPEGTRSVTPMPGPFKKGAFLAARKAGVPLVPVVIRNTGRLMPRGGRAVRAGRVDVVVNPPIDATRWRIAELGERIEDLRRTYIDTLTTGRVLEDVGVFR